MKFKTVLAIETSCDDTSVALVREDGTVIGVKSQNQDEVHAPFGGVIPELACRNHTMRVLPLLDELLRETKFEWDHIDGIAVTNKPGLIGALLIGVTVAKTLSFLHGKPIIGVNHLEGHLHAPLLRDDTYIPPDNFDYPFVGLCVSGGHTSLYFVKGLGKYKLLGRTLDDAAGEAFDKFGKVLGLGYPAGAKMDHAAKSGNPRAFQFPRALMKKGDLNFSFSGLKTAGHLEVQKLTGNVTTSGGGSNVNLSPEQISDLCASYQEAIAEVLVEKLVRALQATKLKRAVLTGGVSANSRLRTLAQERLSSMGVEVLIPPLRYCTDNAAMIGYVGIKRFNRGEKSNMKLSPEAFMKVAEL